MKIKKPLLFTEIQGIKATPVPIENFDIKLYQEKIDDMKKSSDKYDGVGIASVQIGILDSILIAKRSLDYTQYSVFFNPKIIDRSPETGIVVEGCLSIPKVQMPVKRHKWITVEYFDGRETVTEKVDGFLSVVLQHEIAHLEGRTLFDDTVLNREQKRKIFKRF